MFGLIENSCIWANAVLCGRTTIDKEQFMHFAGDPWEKFRSINYKTGLFFDLAEINNDRNEDDPWSAYRVTHSQSTIQTEPRHRQLCDIKHPS